MNSTILLALIAVGSLAFLGRVDAETTTVAPEQHRGLAAKDSKDALKAAKEAKKGKKDCAKDCGPEYDPICVHRPDDASFKPRTFGSQCALDVHNCETGEKLVAKSRGECPGSGGTRLS